MNFLERLSNFQFKKSGTIVLIVLLVTIFMGIGLPKISIQSDLDQMMPQDLEIYQISERIQDNFGGQDSSIILLRLGDVKTGEIYDIRDPKVINFLLELQDSFEGEDLVESVQSAGMVFDAMGLPLTLEQSRQMLSFVPEANAFFNDDYSATIVMISSDLGGGEEKILELENLINEKLDSISKPEEVKVYITGTPQIRTMILELLVNDAVFTLLLAAIIIFILLLILQKSFTKSLLIFIPLILGIVWTLGTMGWLGINLSIATVGIGAMILGLGVEYGIFIISRYGEERRKKSAKNALRVTVKEVGGSVFGSGMTTVMGFLALSLSSMPMLRELGYSLAIGIGFSLLAAVFVNPAMIVLEERYEIWKLNKDHMRIQKKKVSHAHRRKLDEKDN